MSRAALDSLRSQLDQLQRDRTGSAQEIALLNRGDEADRAQSVIARAELSQLDERIAQLRHRIANARISNGPARTDRVVLGTVVEILFDGDTQPEKYLIANNGERAPEATSVSEGSPLGSALFGHQPGDIITYTAPTGRLRALVRTISAA